MGFAVVYDSAIRTQAEALRVQLNAGGCTLRLFVNDLVLEIDASVGDYIEPTFAGYAPIALDGLWLAAEQVRLSWWRLNIPLQSFTVGSVTGETCYGLFIEQSGDLVYAGRWRVPFELPNGLVFEVDCPINCCYSVEAIEPGS